MLFFFAPFASAATDDASSAANQPTLEHGLLTAFGAILHHEDTAYDALMELSAQHPEHNLTRLLLGDRLMARAHREVLLSHPDALDKWRVAGLRDEAVRRLSHQPPPSSHRPTAILQLSPAHRYVLLMDASRARIYLLENRHGEPHLIADYYASIGKHGMGKQQRGDRKSPTGVYRIVKWHDDKTLDELYGSGAYVLDYPNNWDKRQGRTGSGIWVHGTPRTLNNRPPQASRGCVVVNNAVLSQLRKMTTMPTVAVLVPRSYWMPAEDWRLMREALRARVERWRLDWESGNTDRYVAHYAGEYKDDEHDYEAMVKTVRHNAEKKTWLSVGVKDMDLFAYPGDNRQVLAVFDQNYRSNNYKVSYRKQQMWREDSGELKLVYEGRWSE